MKKTPYYEKMASSNTEIKSQRVTASEKRAMNAMYEQVRTRMNKADAIKSKIMDLEDFYPDTTDSLHATTKPFNEEKWAIDMIALELDLDQALIDLELAKKTYVKWFGDKSPTDFLNEEKEG